MTISRLPIEWPSISPSELEPVLEHPRPGLAPAVVTAQCCQRHPQVTWREYAELVAQPSRRAPVVGHRHHGGQVGGDPAQGRQRARPARGRHPSATTEGSVDQRIVYSRPRSRWVASASSPMARSRVTISSDIATLRCLPPVQPMATVMNRLPSRR